MEEELFDVEMQGFMDKSPDPAEVEDTPAPVKEEELKIEEIEETINLVEEEEEVPTLENVDKEKTKQGRDGSVANKDTSSLLFSFASTLVEDGALPSLDLDSAKIETTEDLVEAMRNEIKTRELADLNDLQREALEAMRNGVPVGNFIKSKQATAELDSITDADLASNIDIRKSLIKQDFNSKGYSPERADKFTQRSLDLGEDVADAKEALDSQKRLIQSNLEATIEAQKAQRAAEEARYQQDLDNLKAKVYEETQEVIPGLKFNKRIADQVYDSMTTVVDEVNGQKLNKIMKARMDNPVEFEHKLHYLFNVTKGFTDFSKLTRNAKTAAARSFEENLQLNTISPRSTTNKTKDTTDYGFLERELL